MSKKRPCLIVKPREYNGECNLKLIMIGEHVLMGCLNKYGHRKFTLLRIFQLL